MNLSPRRKTSIRTWILASSIAALAGLAYAQMIGARPIIGAVNGLLIGGGIAALELFVVQRPLGEYLRRQSLPRYIASTTLIWALLIAGTLWSANVIWGHPWGASPAGHPHGSFPQDFAFVFVVCLVINVALRVQSLVGPELLLKFLLGRYHRPQREERVVLILDIADSTALAERLGDLNVQAVISRFFFDIAGPVAEHHGQIHQYIGDAVVITWPPEDAAAPSRCVRCVFAIKDLMARRSAWYREQFGTVPRFRTGGHKGPVVISEVGDDRRAIAFFGDTMNTTARLQQVCKELDRDFLVSAALLDSWDLPTEINAEPFGRIQLAGKERSVEAFALTRDDALGQDRSNATFATGRRVGMGTR